MVFGSVEIVVCAVEPICHTLKHDFPSSKGKMLNIFSLLFLCYVSGPQNGCKCRYVRSFLVWSCWMDERLLRLQLMWFSCLYGCNLFRPKPSSTCGLTWLMRVRTSTPLSCRTSTQSSGSTSTTPYHTSSR